LRRERGDADPFDSRIRWTRGAVADLVEIGEFIQRDNPAAAGRVFNRFAIR
jgi:plasmid stabilization system protein ParE